MADPMGIVYQALNTVFNPILALDPNPANPALTVLIIAFIVSLITTIGDVNGFSTSVMTTILLSSLVVSFLQLGICIALSVVLYVAMWRMFAIFSQNPTLNLILCIFISFVQPFIIFAIRNNEPMHIEKAVSKTEILQETNI